VQTQIDQNLSYNLSTASENECTERYKKLKLKAIHMKRDFEAQLLKYEIKLQTL